MIEVRIPLDKISHDNSVLNGQYILNRLREAGVPMMGVLFPLGASSGALVSFLEPMFGEMVYRWSDDIPK
jgi:hypothetical protein